MNQQNLTTVLYLLAYAILFVGTILGVNFHVIPNELAAAIIGGILTHFGFVGGANVTIARMEEKAADHQDKGA